MEHKVLVLKIDETPNHVENGVQPARTLLAKKHEIMESGQGPNC